MTNLQVRQRGGHLQLDVLHIQYLCSARGVNEDLADPKAPLRRAHTRLRLTRALSVTSTTTINESNSGFVPVRTSRPDKPLTLAL